ncbi:MAG: hypothetical protein QXR89_08370 [Candidatus Bathyarchaeia archaeon]
MYEKIYESWQKEKSTFELTKLPDDFYYKIVEYLRKIREETRMIDQKTLKASLLKKEMENVKHITQELMNLRYKKLAKKLVKGEKIPLNCLTTEEEEILKNASNFAQAYKSFISDLIQRQTISLKCESKGEHKIVILRFLEDVQAIVGLDLKTYGPFKAEDVASLPVENAELLVKKGLAQRILL